MALLEVCLRRTAVAPIANGVEGQEMKSSLRIATIFCLLLCVEKLRAVPSFARQTGLSCNVCHSNPPELTAFGRSFKLRGYTLTNISAQDKVGNSRDLLLSKYIPLSAMILVSDTAYEANQPDTQNGTAGFPQQLSIFLARSFASHFGGLAQFTYTHQDDHFGMDNTDLRSANQKNLGGRDWLYGITLNNNPTVEDVWNSKPAWGFRLDIQQLRSRSDRFADPERRSWPGCRRTGSL